MEHRIISWLQIPCENLQRGTKFYEKVFNASFQFEILNGIPHALFVDGKSEKKMLNGALIEVKGTIKNDNGVVLFFNATGNFENIMKLVEDYGGKILVPKTLIINKESDSQYVIPNTFIDNKPGYYAHFLDSEGNKMGLYGSN